MNYRHDYNNMVESIVADDEMFYTATIITGTNGSGKTIAMKNIAKIFKEKFDYDVIFMPDNRRFGFSKDEIDAIDVISKLNGNMDIKDFIKKRYDLDDPFILKEVQKNDIITSGYMHVINYFYTLASTNKNKEVVFMVDNFELSLHPLLIKRLLLDLNKVFKIKHFIITSYDITKYTKFGSKKTYNIIYL